ncbi:MAG: ATP synthase subunit I [Desulfobacterales bacterium]|nr:ATP synthase subunit I [Desulfobacterales bacterium]
MADLQKLVNFVTRTNWLLFLGTSLVALWIAPQKVYLGVFLGGLIVAVNFQLLKKTVVNNLNAARVMEKGGSLVGNLLVKYYIRFAISGTVIFLLIKNHIVHPLGLLAGLSVVVASMFLATVLELTRLFFKEAV